MSAEARFRNVAVLGTGLIGGSFALALRAAFPSCAVSGWDWPEVLRRAVELGAITRVAASIEEAVSGADLVYIALPIGVTLDLLPEVARHAPAGSLVTDAAGTILRQTSENPAVYLVRLLFSFRGVDEVEVPAERIKAK